MYQFVATMPAVYENLYSSGEAAEHAAIVARREGRLVHAELWQSSKGPQLCVVAEDRPGLLALVTDALLAQGLAIQSARAFCRQVARSARGR
jgi:UTP:GlnB (protein PII) uridylyltransferase